VGVDLGASETDEDGDGICNYLEYLMGRNPMQRDSDVLHMGQEDMYGLGQEYFTLSFELNSTFQRTLCWSTQLKI